MLGEFVWHSHADSDDFFLVLSGRLLIDLPDETVGNGGMQLHEWAFELAAFRDVDGVGRPASGELPGDRRFSTDDPFGNRIELIAG